MFRRNLIGAVVVVAAFATLALPVIAQAAPFAQMKATVNRKASKWTLTVTANASNKLTASKIVVTGPKGYAYNTQGFKFCSAKKINTSSLSSASCPKGSLVGKGTASAFLPASPFPPYSPINLKLSTKIFAASKHSVTFFVVATTPGYSAIVHDAFTAPIKSVGGRPVLTVPIPVTPFQQPIIGTGLYAYLTSLVTNLGAKSPGKNGKQFLRVGSCPKNHKLQFNSVVTWAANPSAPPAPTKASTTAHC